MHLWIFFSFSESFFKEPFASVLRKACSEKLLKICRKTTPVLESVVSQKRLLFLKRYPGISVFLWIVRTFSEQLFWRTFPEGCFCNSGGCLCLKRASCWQVFFKIVYTNFSKIFGKISWKSFFKKSYSLVTCKQLPLHKFLSTWYQKGNIYSFLEIKFLLKFECDKLFKNFSLC